MAGKEAKRIGWRQICWMMRELASKIKQSGYEPDVIVGIARGGWIPARMLSDLLCNFNLASVRAESYLGRTKKHLELTQPVSTSVRGKKVLVVDEVIDTGDTAEIVKKHLEAEGAAEVRFATIYLKTWSTFRPDYFHTETDMWIVFPWELGEDRRFQEQKIDCPKKQED